MTTNRPKNSAEVPTSPLEDQDDQADAPGDEHRPEIPGPGQVDAEHPPAGQGEHIPLGHQVAGEEHGQRQLGELLGLDAPDPGNRDLDLGGGTGDLADAGREDRGQRDQHQADGAERIGVALQRAWLPDEGEHGHEGRHPDRGVEHLQRGGGRVHGGDHEARVAAPPGLLQAVDHHDAEAVEQRGQRQQQRIGIRRQPAHRDVGRGDQDGERQAVLEHPRRDLAVQAEPDVRVGEHDHADHEDQHEQFGPAPAPRRGSGIRLAALPGAGVGAKRMPSGGGDRAQEVPPVPVAVLPGAGQSAGMVGFGGLTCFLTVLPLTLVVTVVGLVFSHFRSAWSAFWHRT